MPKVSEAYLETRRQHILDSAMACFARKGFHQSTMEDIGDEAGLSPGLAYRYFANKEEIIVESIQESVDRSIRFFDAMADEEDIQLVLEKMIDDSFRRFEQPNRDIYYKVIVQLWAEAIQNPKVADEVFSLRYEALQQLASIIKLGQARGQILPNLDPEAVAIAIMSSHDGFVVHWLADPALDIWQYRTVLIRMVRSLFNHQE